MKYKKYSYIIVLILMLMAGINKTYAKESKQCYYMSEDASFKASLKVSWGYSQRFTKTLNDYAKVSVDKIGEGGFEFNKEVVANWTKAGLNNWYSQCTKGKAVCFDPYFENEKAANEVNNPACPKYLVFQYCNQYYVWGTESKSLAEAAVKDAQDNNCSGYYASYEKDGKPVTAQEYYSEFVSEGLITFDDVTQEPTCTDYEAIFGDKNNPDSIRYMVDEILTYIRIIVPILIILFGTIDFAKAVIAGKEDNMKKAQTDFIKRIAAGVIVFLAPTIIDIIMSLADIVWQGEYIHCNL